MSDLNRSQLGDVHKPCHWMRLGDAHLQVFGQTSDDQFLGCIQVTPKYKTKRKGAVWSRERFVGQGGVVLCLTSADPGHFLQL